MKCRLLYISASLTPFFLWGSQRKQLIYVDAIFVSIVAPTLFTSSLLTQFISTKPIAVTQLPFSMNRLIPFLRNHEWQHLSFLQMTIASFVIIPVLFSYTFKKAITTRKFCNRDKPMFGPWNFCVIYSVRVFSWSFSPTSPSGAFAKLFSVTSTSCRSNHYPIFGKLCLERATLKVEQPPLLHHFTLEHINF